MATPNVPKNIFARGPYSQPSRTLGENVASEICSLQYVYRLGTGPPLL